MSSKRNQRPAKPAKLTSPVPSPKSARTAFPKWPTIMGCAAVLIALNLLLFHRKLLVVFQDTHAPVSTSTKSTNSANGSVGTTNVTGGSPAAGSLAENDRDKALNLFTRGTE